MPDPTPPLQPALPNYRPMCTVWGIKSLTRAIVWWWQQGQYGKALSLCGRIPAAVAWSVRYRGWDAPRDDSAALLPPEAP